ncbi:MAG TPA: hypothetical protein VHV55_11445 [Pirellulales bacterium]|nr:hypothetical protein [Pirellulales bacterium]
MGRSWGLLALGALALAARLACIAVVGDATSGPVTYEHGEIAANLLAGRGFSCRFLGAEGPTSQQAPLYPLLLAGCYWLLGQGHLAILAIQLGQALLGSATALLTASLAWSLVPAKRSVGWLAGAVVALYPPHVYMVTHVQVVTLATFLLTAALALAARAQSARTWRGAAFAGLTAGLLLLVDPILALALPWLAALRWMAGGNSLPAGRRLVQTAVMAGVAVGVVAPWIVRNYWVHAELVFVKSTFGYAFWQGNNPQSWGTDKVPQPAARQLLAAAEGASLAEMNRSLWAARHKTLYIDDVVLTPADYRQLAAVSEPRRSAMLGRRAWQFVRTQPAAYARLCWNRLRYFLLLDETNPKTSHPLYRWSSIAWLALTVIGGLSAGRLWKRLWPLAGVFGSLLVFHTLTITSSRFRMPLEPLSLVWAAAGLLSLAGLARLALAFIGAHKPLILTGSGRIHHAALAEPGRSAAPG